MSTNPDLSRPPPSERRLQDGFDRLRLAAFQARETGPAPLKGQLWDWAGAKRGLSLRSLALLRWAALFGQLVAVLFVYFGLGYALPLIPCLGVIAASAFANLSSSLAWPSARLSGSLEAVVQLGFDLVQLSLLLGLTGGLQNPFALLLIAPAAVGAATLRTRDALILTGLAIAASLVLAFFSAPLPSPPGGAPVLAPPYRIGLIAGQVVGICFTTAYALQASAEAARMELALAATQAVLAREQRLSALGGLAAAAAHELGTPLATIQVVAKEMARGVPDGTPFFEDLQLLVNQAERCREILRKLSRTPDTSDAHHARMSLSQLLDEVVDPHRTPVILINCEVTCDPGAAILEVRRSPEALHALSSFVENAVDFAESAVEVVAHYGADSLEIMVRDDGPGFSPDVIARLGEPYVTTRSHGENSRSDHHGMGLGFFIAKTLLERTGAHVQFRNARGGGAVILASWPRSRIEASPEGV